MVKDMKSFQMDQNIKANLNKVPSVEKALLNGIMEKYMKVNGLME